ncbi:MAG: hypothetical protein NTU57_05475 [Candidatus Aenigmarchaeota archaeon]|nr:hypothetical protein [Candidatus Aenigmarchaeota archaeon]
MKMFVSIFFAIFVILVVSSSGCINSAYEGTLLYQKADANKCEAYYIVIKEKPYEINTTLVGDLDDYVNKSVRIRGELITRTALKKCLFETTINAADIQLID